MSIIATLRAFQRLVAAAVLAPLVGAGPVLPAGHVHEADAGHSRAIAHRHLDPHAFGAPRAHETAEFDDRDPDAGIVWMAAAATSHRAFAFARPAAPRSQAAATLIPDPGFFKAVIDQGAPAHGPPRSCLSHRGPPSSPLS